MLNSTSITCISTNTGSNNKLKMIYEHGEVILGEKNFYYFSNFFEVEKKIKKN